MSAPSHRHLLSVSFQPFLQVNAGPNLPQPTKTADQGQKYWYGRGVREPADIDMTVLSLGERDLPRVDTRRDRSDHPQHDEDMQPASSSADVGFQPKAADRRSPQKKGELSATWKGGHATRGPSTAWLPAARSTAGAAGDAMGLAVATGGDRGGSRTALGRLGVEELRLV